MPDYLLRRLPSGHIFIDPGDDCDRIVDILLGTDYSEDFCLARDFDEDFIGRLMESGFLVMSMKLKDDEDKTDSSDEPVNAEPSYSEPGYTEPFYILLPKLHLVRSALFFPELHIKKSIRRFLSMYELRVDTDFDLILDKCVRIHGEDWLTPPLVEVLKSMRRRDTPSRVKPVSFALYRDGVLKAGEVGVVIGRVYTSYSGYYEEKNSGTVQMILMSRWLEKTGFDFLDLGMPLDYKTALGAQDIEPRRFVQLFRAARY